MAQTDFSLSHIILTEDGQVKPLPYKSEGQVRAINTIFIDCISDMTSRTQNRMLKQLGSLDHN